MKISNNQVIRNLRQNGFRVLVNHYRYTPQGLTPQHEIDGNNPFKRPNVKGGKTQIVLENKKTGERFLGDANCSLLDNFCKKDGVQLALRRALDNLSKQYPSVLGKVFCK